jgi:hypothetical protein
LTCRFIKTTGLGLNLLADEYDCNAKTVECFKEQTALAAQMGLLALKLFWRWGLAIKRFAEKLHRQRLEIFFWLFGKYIWTHKAVSNFPQGKDGWLIVLQGHHGIFALCCDLAGAFASNHNEFKAVGNVFKTIFYSDASHDGSSWAAFSFRGWKAWAPRVS